MAFRGIATGEEVLTLDLGHLTDTNYRNVLCLRFVRLFEFTRRVVELVPSF